MIPPRNTVSTKYYRFVDAPKDQPERQMDKDVIDKMMMSNTRVIHIFNAEYHGELELKVINEEKREIEISRYMGSDSKYEVPELVLKDASDSEGYVVVSIGGYSFGDNKKLESITIPGSVRSIKFQAFADCKMLSNVELSEGLEIIDAWAFLECKRLKTLTLPSSVKEVGDSALTTLEEVRIKCPRKILRSGTISKACIVKEINEEQHVDNEGEDECLEIDDEITKFTTMLDKIEREYLEAIINGDSPMRVLMKYNKKPAMVELSINEKYIEAFDIDDQIVNDGIIEEDYVELLRRAL